jgi:hypothetical protein
MPSILFASFCEMMKKDDAERKKERKKNMK